MYSPLSPQASLSSELRLIINERNMLSMRSRMKVLHALNEDNEKCAEEKEKILRSQAIQEILTTEVTYLQQLEILAEFFIQPILKRKLLDHPLLVTLAENIKTLYNVSGELVAGLKRNPDNIAGVFHKLAPFFKLYSVYAYDYTQVLNLLQTNEENDSVFKKFICDQETRSEVGRKLSSLLITPVQRVPRYQLLVKQVLQHTPYRHREYRHLQACLVEIEKSAKHINTLIAQNEETQKLLNLQKCIVTSINLVKPGRMLIKQGPLMRVSRRGNSTYRRYFVLLNDTLLYCKGEPETSLNISCVLPLNKCSLTCVLSKKLFRITCLHETFLLYSENADSAEWIQSIQNAIKKYTECRQTLRKESSSRKPLRHKNINEFSSDDIPKKSIKRKRCIKDEQVSLDTSNIIYFKKDNEMDEDTQSNNICLPITTKRFKQNEYSKPGHTSPQVKNTKLKLCKNKNTQSISTPRCLKKSSHNNYKVNRNAFYIIIFMKRVYQNNIRHKNINEFSSDDIPKKSIKRKRCIKDEQITMEGPLEIKNSSAVVEEPIKSEVLVQNSDNNERSDAASPPPNCSICLGKLVNTSFTDSCLHQFCFTCLLQWSKIKTECPLCKQTFKSIIHNVRSEEDYDQYHVPRELASQIPQPQVTATLDVNFDVDWESAPRRFVYRTTMTGSRRHGVLLNPEQVTRREQLPSMAPQVPREERRRRRANPTDYRRTVYRHGIWATSLPDIFGRFRECSADYYRRQPQELDRLIPWLNRELQVLLNNEPTHVAYVLSIIMEALTQYDIRSPEFRNIVRPFFAIHTDHFAHELLNFAQTNFDLVGYDQSVTYLPRGLSNEYATRIESPTSSSSSSSSSSLVFDNSDVRILAEAIDLRINAEMPNTLAHPISMPGPSAAGQMFHRVETSNTVPELLIVSSSSSESDGDCEIIGYVKPRHERTPEIIELLSSDTEHVCFSHTLNGNMQSTTRRTHLENTSLPSTSYVKEAKESSSSSYSVSSTDVLSDSDNNPRPSRRNRSKKSGKKAQNSSDSSSSESLLKKYNEKRLRKPRYRVQAKGTRRIKLIKREESYSDEDSSSDSSSTETDNKMKTKKCYREYKSKRDCSSSITNDHTVKSGKITRNKEKTFNLEKLKSKNKDLKCCENRQSRSRSNSISSNASERDKRPNHKHRECRNTNEFGSQDDSASINKDMSRSEYKSKSKKKICYSSDSEDDCLRSCSQCSDYSNKSYSHWKKSKRKEKYKDKERYRSSSRIFNLSQSNASTILTMSISSKNDMYPTKHSDRNGSDCKEKHKSRKESKYRKSENEKKSRPKKKKRRLQSSSTSG
ncbi:E3 ubiquitin-protein ligase Topor [Acromyrmex echinatior]|uniref:E3 ubiquitin-protein ligase Topors n=1 Tax=Acromyrmex echinatior TaxID=103372 RepID=F4WUF1_ACREC|nr:E3 ubiquitin-protein ligase Topor [Acromyrmex echinatior]